MEQRELGMDEVEKRCRPLYDSLSLKKVLRLPSKAVDENDMPCVLIMEGDDVITKRSSMSYLGYPCKRNLNVLVECWDFISGDVRNICEEVRKAVLANEGVLITGVIIREEKSVGPFNLNIPNVLGKRIIFGMTYLDSGPAFT